MRENNFIQNYFYNIILKMLIFQDFPDPDFKFFISKDFSGFGVVAWAIKEWNKRMFQAILNVKWLNYSILT